MITVRIRHIDPSTKAETVARVTAKNIEAAVLMFPGSVLFPIEPEEYFAGSAPSVETLQAPETVA